MAIEIKTLGQADPAVDTLTTAYTVPANRSAVISSLVVCNRAATATSFRIAISPAGASILSRHYLYYNTPISGNNTFIATVGATMEAASVVRVYADDANLSFSIFGNEVYPDPVV